MDRLRRIALTTLVCCLCGGGARAELLPDWIQELSGPGPFRSPFGLPFSCRTSIGPDVQGVRPCDDKLWVLDPPWGPPSLADALMVEAAAEIGEVPSGDAASARRRADAIKYWVHVTIDRRLGALKNDEPLGDEVTWRAAEVSLERTIDTPISHLRIYSGVGMTVNQFTGVNTEVGERFDFLTVGAKATQGIRIVYLVTPRFHLDLELSVDFRLLRVTPEQFLLRSDAFRGGFENIAGYRGSLTIGFR